MGLFNVCVRAPGRGLKGIVKTCTCWSVPIYRKPLSEDIVEIQLETYYRPYHGALGRPKEGMTLGVDCHTIAAKGPPIVPGPCVEST